MDYRNVTGDPDPLEDNYSKEEKELHIKELRENLEDMLKWYKISRP